MSRSNDISLALRRTVDYVRRYPLHREHKKFIYLVYSMGKVGSSTVYHTLRDHLPFAAIFHVHFLSDHWLRDVLPHANRPREIERGFAIRDYIEKNPDQRLRVVTLVREPVSRDVSDLFETPSDVVGDRDVAALSFEEIAERFERKKVEDDYTGYTLSWLDTELGAYLGVDLYGREFPKLKGYDVLRFDACDVLVIRLEDLNDCYREAFLEFAGLRIDGLRVANVSGEKPLKHKVDEFKRRYRVPVGELEKLYGSKYMKHFYTDEEIAGFTRRWSAG